MELTEDSILEQIRALEEHGFYLHSVGFKSKAPRVHHHTKAARARKPSEDVRESRRAMWRRKQGTLKGKWRHLKKTMRQRGVVSNYVEMSYDDWVLLWRKAGAITLGDGSTILAWKARGRSKEGGWGDCPEKPQLRRWDLEKPYTLANTYVQYKGYVLADGDLLSEQKLNHDKEFEEKA